MRGTILFQELFNFKLRDSFVTVPTLVDCPYYRYVFGRLLTNCPWTPTPRLRSTLKALPPLSRTRSKPYVPSTAMNRTWRHKTIIHSRTYDHLTSTVQQRSQFGTTLFPLLIFPHYKTTFTHKIITIYPRPYGREVNMVQHHFPHWHFPIIEQHSPIKLPPFNIDPTTEKSIRYNVISPTDISPL